MTANASFQLLLDLSEAINTWVDGSVWDGGLVNDRLDGLRKAGEADTSKPLLTELYNRLKETVDALEELDKHKIVVNKTRSELWRSLSAASLQEVLKNFNAAVQKYREYINPEGLAVGKELPAYSWVALVIGVGDYNKEFIPPLKNAPDDARTIRNLLFKQGPFTVESALPCINPNRIELVKALNVFNKRVDENKNCIALLFYSGHGIVHQNRHYMVPKDWDSTDGALESFGVEVGGRKGALSKMKSAAAGIALFDMCRVPPDGLQDEPESPGGHGNASEGLDEFSKVGVCFATASGSLASDGLDCSPFAKALRKAQLESESDSAEKKTRLRFKRLGEVHNETGHAARHCRLAVALYLGQPSRRGSEGIMNLGVMESTIQGLREFILNPCLREKVCNIVSNVPCLGKFKRSWLGRKYIHCALGLHQPQTD